MKKFLVILPILALLMVITGCPDGNGTTNPVKKPVTGIVIKDGATVITSASIISVAVGGQAKILDLSVTPAGAENIDGFTVQASGEPAKASVTWNASTGKLTVTPLSESEAEFVVTVRAHNNDNGDEWITTSFKLKVNRAGQEPVTDIVIKDGTETLTAASVITVMVGGQDKLLDVSVIPSEAEAVDGFTVEAESSNTGMATASYNATSKKVTITPVAETSADITITVKAKNSDNTDWVTTSFKVSVEPESGIEPESIQITLEGNSTVQNGNTIQLDLMVADTIRFSAKVLPENAMGSVSWSSEDEAVATVDDGVVNGFKAGSSVITAFIEDTTVKATVTINVTIDPNIIFMWSHARNGEPSGMGNWRNGTNNNTANASSGIISGFGSQYADIPISISTAGAADNDQVSYNGGIILDGSTGQGTQKVISIGLATGRAPLSDVSVHPAGKFNFFDVPANMGIKVSAVCSIETEANDGNIRMSLNNNSQNAANTMMVPYLGSRFFYLGPPKNSTVPDSGMVIRDGEGKIVTLVSNVFKPSDFTSGNDNLKTAHISISASDPAAGGGGKIKITGIKIEYVPAGSLDIVIDPEADFTGLPETITISKTGSTTSINLSLTKFSTAEWYIDGVLKATAATYLLNASDLKTGDHSLTVIVNTDGNLYSKSMQFTVAE